jgi:AcrR family transcriptional regulator
MATPGATMKGRTGRRPGTSDSREVILDAATKLFSERGYDGASMRTIAAAAGVDPALIRHFFGDKDTLFATVVADRTVIYERVAAALPGDPSGIGQRLADTYLRLWEEAPTRPILMAVLRSATTSDRAAEMLQEALGRSVRAHTGVRDSDYAQRLAFAGAQLFGLAVARHIIKVPSIVRLAHDELVVQVAPTIQRYLTATHQ